MNKAADRAQAKILWILAGFIVFMHFEGILKLLFSYHPLIHGAKYYFFSILFALICITRKETLEIPPISFAILLYAVAVGLQFLNPIMWVGRGLILSTVGLFNYLAYVPLFFITASMLDAKAIHKIMGLIIGLATLSALLAHFQYYIGDAAWFAMMPFEPTHFIRSHSFKWGPVAFDVMPPVFWYLPGLIFSLHFYFQDRYRFLMTLLVLNFLAAILPSGFRKGILMGLVCILVYLFFRIHQILEFKHLKRIAISLVCAGLIFGFFYEQVLDETERYRLDSIKNPIEGYIRERGFTWKYTPKIISLYPLGAGLRHAGRWGSEAFGVSRPRTWFGDNYFNTILGELGIFGLISLLTVYYFAAKHAAGAYLLSEDKQKRMLIACFGALLLVFAGGGIFGNPVAWMFWLYLGILFRVPQLDDRTVEKRNTLLEDSLLFSKATDTMRGSFMGKWLDVKADSKILQIIGVSETARFFQRVIAFIRSSRSIRIIEKILS